MINSCCCQKLYMLARDCTNNAPTTIGMTSTDAATFTGSFSYATTGGCYYFNFADAPVMTLPGTLLTPPDVMSLASCAACLPACTGSPLACPSGAAASYTLSMPNISSWGSCSPVACSGGSPLASAIVSGSFCSWTFSSASATCVSGYKQPSLKCGLSNGISALSPNCPSWNASIFFANAGGSIAFELVYEKLRAGATVNDIIGTYNLSSINVFGGGACIGASADATITVSP